MSRRRLVVTAHYVGLMPGAHDREGRYVFPRCALCECRASFVVNKTADHGGLFDSWNACAVHADEIAGSGTVADPF